MRHERCGIGAPLDEKYKSPNANALAAAATLQPHRYRFIVPSRE